jgi:2,4-dienoyl-CoA reductase-like NADH-dependent reductase (Old Yellow Enzyme family)
MPKERYRLYHEEKAKGGIGLTMIGRGPRSWRRTALQRSATSICTRTKFVPLGCVNWPTAFHEHNTAVMCQITHWGAGPATTTATGCPWSIPSPLREPAHRAFPKVAEEWDMDRIVRAYADGHRSLLAKPAWTGSKSRPTPTCSTRSGLR